MSTLKKLIYAGLGAMVVLTGGYLVVYTARWEWQRALAAGELLLVSMIVLLGLIVVDRFGRLERRLGELSTQLAARAGQTVQTGAPDVGGALSPAHSGAPLPYTRPYGTPGAPPPKFQWLQPERYGVFIPVLLGAGIAVAGLAALVERIAAKFGTRGPARRPGLLQPPSAGVLAGGGGFEEVRASAASGGRGRRQRLLVIGLAVALTVGLAVQEIAEHTQDRPDGPAAAPYSTVVFKARTSKPEIASAPLAERQWEYCRGSTRPYITSAGLTSIGNGQYAAVVQPALGEHALRRLKGCLEDTVVDYGQFHVVSVQPDDED